MDSIPDLSPVNAQPQSFSAIPTTNGAHPPYPDMIVEAIVALKDRDGSSRQAIAKFIERHHPNLPPTHSSLLTHHLKRMKNEGQLTMVKHSYMLTPPRSVPFEAPTPAPAATMDHNIADYSITSTDTYGTSPGFKAENSSVQPRRKPGRPPKPRHEFGFQVQNHQPENQPAAEIPPYQPQFENQLGTGQDFHPQNTCGQDLQPPYGSVQEFQGNYAVTAAEPIFASLGLADDGATVAPPVASPETAVVSAKRGRGRPPKNASATKPVVTSSGDAGGDAGGVAGGDTGGDAAGGGGNGDASGGGGEVGRVRRKVGRPKLKSIMLFNGGGMKRGVGRPKRIGRPVTVPLSGNVMRSRGRPRKLVPRPAQIVSVNGGDGEGVGVGEVGSVSRGRGRPRKASDTARKSISQSFGWPTQFGAGTSVIVTDPTQLVAYQELKSKYEHLQSKAREVVEVARPYINSDYEASGVLQELETLLGTTNAAA